METNTCPTCHSPIPAHAPGGFCPACLLRDAEEPPSYGHSAPPSEEIAAAFPQWEVIELIGQGGMGFVYKVRQPSLDRIVALKILSPELGRDPAFAERFAREARTLGKLQHPNIVTIFEHGEKDGFFYLLMEYVDGVNLRQAMRAGRFSPEQALAIVPGICDALQAAHAQGIWHRDIKPENILLDREGKVKIADFGIARIVGDPQRDFTLTRTGNALGSVSYMAPEQHEKPHEVDHRADIYSLGVVIYEMLTGELPLGRFPAPSQRAAVDARIDGIVFKTLEKERELRQQSATEVKTELENSRKQFRDRVERGIESMPARPSALFHWSLALLVAGGTIAAMGYFKASELATLLDSGSSWKLILNAHSVRLNGLSPGFLIAFWPSAVGFILGTIGCVWNIVETARRKRDSGALEGIFGLKQQSVNKPKTDVHHAIHLLDPVGLRPAVPAASKGNGLGKLAFGLFLFGVTIPFILRIISERVAEVGFMLSALMMLLALVLGLFSFRETLGKITAVCSILTLLVYGAFIAFMSRGPGPIHSQGERVETRNSEPQPNPEHDFSTPKSAVESIVKAAQERNARVFQNGISRSLKATIKGEGERSDQFGDFAHATFISAETLDATNAEVVVEANDGSQRRFTFWMILEDGEWKLNELGSKPSKE